MMYTHLPSFQLCKNELRKFEIFSTAISECHGLWKLYKIRTGRQTLSSFYTKIYSALWLAIFQYFSKSTTFLKVVFAVSAWRVLWRASLQWQFFNV